MKKFSKLLAVVLAIAIVICPMMSAVAFAEGENTVALTSVDNTHLLLTINSTNGFMVTKATVAFTGDVCNFSVADYTIVGGTEHDEYNEPEVTLNKGTDTATFIVAATDAACMDLYSQVKISIEVAAGETITLNNLQAASDKDESGNPGVELKEFAGIGTDGTPTETIEESAALTDSDLKLSGAGLTMANGFAIDFYVKESLTNYEQYTDVYVTFEKDRYDINGNVTETRTTTVPYSNMVNANSRYYYTLTGVQPQEMGTLVRATIFGTKSGRLYQGTTVEYSVLKFAYSQYKKTSDANTLAMFADMVNYGAAVQTYANYNTTNHPIANEFTTLVGNNTWTTKATSTTRTYVNSQSNTPLTDATMKIKSAGLTLADKVYLFFNITDTSNAVVDCSDYYLDVTYTAGSGSAKHIQVDIVNGVANIDQLNSTDLSSVLTATLKTRTGNNAVSNTITYSAETFVSKNLSGMNGALVAMMKYADSVKACAF